MIVTDSTATGGTPAGSTYVNSWTADISISGDSVMIVTTYQFGSSVYPYSFTAIGTIASDGNMSGTWSDTIGDSGTWTNTSGLAVKTHTGNTGWSGLFTTTVPAFTFTTDDSGSGSWHINLRDGDFPGTGTYTLSAWINEAGGTMLISDIFDVEVD